MSYVAIGYWVNVVALNVSFFNDSISPLFLLLIFINYFYRVLFIIFIGRLSFFFYQKCQLSATITRQRTAVWLKKEKQSINEKE